MPCIINFMCFQKWVAVTFFQTISNFQEEKKNNFRKKLNCQAFVFCCACILEPGDILQELQYVDVLQNCNISNINFICRCNSVTRKKPCAPLKQYQEHLQHCVYYVFTWPSCLFLVRSVIANPLSLCKCVSVN